MIHRISPKLVSFITLVHLHIISIQCCSASHSLKLEWTPRTRLQGSDTSTFVNHIHYDSSSRDQSHSHSNPRMHCIPVQPRLPYFKPPNTEYGQSFFYDPPALPEDSVPGFCGLLSSLSIIHWSFFYYTLCVILLLLFATLHLLRFIYLHHLLCPSIHLFPILPSQRFDPLPNRDSRVLSLRPLSFSSPSWYLPYSLLS